VRYDGGHCLNHPDASGQDLISQWQQQGLLLPLCPEVAGGLPVPRPAAEIQAQGMALQVLTLEHIDVTTHFQSGAEQALALCKKHNIHIAILKEGSPSCGSGLINDGSFTNTKIQGEGVTTQLLRKHGIRVFNEMQTEDVLLVLKQL